MKITALVILTAFSFLSFAEGISLQQCFQEAKKHYESVGEKGEVIIQNGELYNQAVGSMLPTVNGNGSYLWQKNVSNSQGQSITPPYQPQWGVSVTQPLFQAGLFNGLKAADAQYRQSQHDKKYSEIQLFENLSATFFSVLAQEKDLQNLATEIHFYDTWIEDLNRFLKIGRSQMTDVLAVEVSRAQLVATLENEKGQLASTRQQFQVYSGMPANSVLDNRIEPLPFQIKSLDYYLGRLDERYDVKRDREGINYANQGVWVAKEQHLPTVSFKFDRYFERFGIYNEIDWDAGLQISIPIFAGGITQSKVRQAESLLEGARLTSSLTDRSGEQEIRATYELTVANLIQIEALKKYVKLSHDSFEEQKRNFRLGLVRNIDVLQALAAYVDSTRSLDNARFNLKANVAHLDAASAFDIEKEN